MLAISNRVAITFSIFLALPRHLPFKISGGEDEFTLLANFCKSDKVTVMKFVMAIFVFLLFAALLTGGIVLLLHGHPGLLIFALLFFFGTFIKYGCLSH